ncbi:MAG TPA: hypothetical protein VMU57_20830 [Edaphobacter sp.]|uniref:hypothetical protein n=1 Tax=Edaphobacter sp. TaxID=1934404 RepID=UPI002B7FDF61|nr:hypothetical protein [Edaphobacter sp.]HUZ97356.1 hypothetical protein [Edaphobacter sp.]
MDLREMLSLIARSSREDWNVNTGEQTFHHQFSFERVSSTLHAEAHTGFAVYIPNVSISMEWGLEWREKYDAAWVREFPDKHASGDYLDIFFNHAWVYRAAFVTVDGGGARLPLPNNDSDLVVEKGACDLIKREFPRLCRGGSSSLTFAGVHPRNSER